MTAFPTASVISTPVLRILVWGACGLMILVAGGCASPYRRDQGALFGAGAGAGVGAIIGEAASDNPLAGAVIGAGVGALTGAVVGGNLDEIEARNRAEIEARLGRPAPTGVVTVADVVAMTQAGVSEDVIVTHIQIHGVTHPPTTPDIIHLQQQGVGPRVIQAMQTPRPPRPPIAAGPPPPVIVEEHYWHDYPGPPWPYRYHRHPRRHHHGRGPHRRGGVSWGVSFSN